MFELSNSRNGTDDSCSVGERCCLIFVGDEVFDDDDEDVDDGIFTAVGKLGGRRSIRGTRPREASESFVCWVFELDALLAGRMRFCVERDFGMFFVDNERVSKEIAVGGRRAWDEDVVDDGDGFWIGTGGGGVDDVDPSRSLFIELDVWAA